VYRDGIPHATRAAIGEWLEYADPQKAIDKLLERNRGALDISGDSQLIGPLRMAGDQPRQRLDRAWRREASLFPIA